MLGPVVCVLTSLLGDSEASYLRTTGLGQWFSVRGDFASRGHLLVSEDVFNCHDWDGGCH